MGVEEAPLIELGNAGAERGHLCELVAVAGVAAYGEVVEPAGIERLSLAFGVLLRWWQVGHEGGLASPRAGDRLGGVFDFEYLVF